MRFLRDSMTDANGTALTAHTPESGGSWTHVAGTNAVAIQSNRAQSSTAAGPHVYLYSRAPLTRECSVQADYTRVAVGAQCTTALLARFTDYSNMYFSRYDTSPARWELFKRVAGTFTSLGSYSQAFASGSHTASFTVFDAAKTVHIDGVQRISSTDNAITAVGAVGLDFNGAAGAADDIAVDNVIADDTRPNWHLRAGETKGGPR